MNIFSIIPRNIQIVTVENSIDFVVHTTNSDVRPRFVILCKTYIRLSTDPTSTILRVLNGEISTCRPSHEMTNFQLMWDGNNNLIYKNIDNGRIAFKVDRDEIERLGLSESQTTDFMIEVGEIFKNIARDGRMPRQYRIEPTISIEERSITNDTQPRKEHTEMIDDIPDDVFTMETIIDRIRNCGSIANAKEVPVIIRFGDKKLMITDTSVENGFLYLDVIEVPKKEIEKPSIKFSDYFKSIDIEEFTRTLGQPTYTYFETNVATVNSASTMSQDTLNI